MRAVGIQADLGADAGARQAWSAALAGSDAGSYITGQNLFVDGGMSL